MKLSPDILLSAYSQGAFPMASDVDDPEIGWYCPELRGQLSIPNMHIPRRLRKNVRQMKIGGRPYGIRINSNFPKVVKSCAAITSSRSETWINSKILDAYCELHKKGHAHSVECWQDDSLVGGLYGVSIGGAFFGESMFSIARDASKVSLVHLVAHLSYSGFRILDTQFTNDHLEQFGVFEVPHEEYMRSLVPVLSLPCKFDVGQVNEKEVIAKYFEINP
ncbi:MAG: leucyl/phenylalanyl-tRNA--protein transferase [Alphaproteobacteria bacterium]